MIVVFGSIYFNPLFWVSDYPPDIEAAVGTVDLPIGQQLVVGVLMFLIVIGVPIYSNAKLKRQNNGKLSFLTAFVQSALICFYFAVWDLVVHDWLILSPSSLTLL